MGLSPPNRIQQPDKPIGETERKYMCPYTEHGLSPPLPLAHEPAAAAVRGGRRRVERRRQQEGAEALHHHQVARELDGAGARQVPRGAAAVSRPLPPNPRPTLR